MKKLSAFALLTAVSAVASAQSSVTLFGIVDVGVRQVKNGDNDLSTLSTNGASSSRIGFRGVEDLGGGLSAGFWLEAGVAADVGSTGSTSGGVSRFFDRRSTISLSGGFGEVRLGRDTLPTYTLTTDFDVISSTGIGSSDKFYSTPNSSTLGSGAQTAKRDDNLIAYYLPKSLGGFYGQVSAAAGEGTAGTKYVGGRLGYAAGPFNVSVAHGQTDVTPNASGEDKYTVTNIGASYDFGIVKLSGYYSELKFDPKKLNIANIGVSVPLGNGALRASYSMAEFKGGAITGATADGVEAEAIALSYLYNLSRRTTLYASVAQVTNKGSRDLGTYGVDGFAVPAGRNSRGFEAGIRHSF